MSRPQTASEAAEADLMVMFEFSRQKQDIKSFKLQFWKLISISRSWPEKSFSVLFSVFSVGLRGSGQKSLSPLHCQPCHRDLVLRQRQLRIRHFTGHQILGTVQQKIGHWHLVLRQTLLFVIDRELGQAHDQRAGLGGARVHRVPRAVRNLWKKCQDCHRTASGRSATPPGKKYSDLRGAITKSPTLTIGNGINTINKEHLF